MADSAKERGRSSTCEMFTTPATGDASGGVHSGSPKTGSSLAKSRWQKAVGKVRAADDPWAKHAIEARPAERVVEHRYDSATRAWSTAEAIVRVQDVVFDEGAMRVCHRIKKIGGFELRAGA